MRVRTLFRVACVALAAAVVAGCSGSGSADNPSGDSSADYERAVADRLRGGSTPGPGGETEHDRGQRFLVGCMAKEGFTYHSVQPARPEHETLGLTDRQFKLKYGWGLSTLIDRRQAEFVATPQDPNERDQATMSETQRAAYGTAMTKCQRDMLVEAGVMPPQLRLPTGSPLSDAITAATDAAAADQRVVDVKARWAACMRSQGFDYARGEQLQQDLLTRVEPLRQAYVTRGQSLVGRGSSWATLTVQDVLTTDEVRRLDAIQVFELSAATADVACQDQGIDVTAVADQVQAEYLRKAMDAF